MTIVGALRERSPVWRRRRNMLVDRLVAFAVWCRPALASVELPFNGVNYTLFQCIAGGEGSLGYFAEIRSKLSGN